MDYAAENIEWIVREVMRRLGSGTAAVHAGEQTMPDEAAASDRQLRVAGHIVTLADVADRLDGIATVAVPPRAVVTPSVRDLLRQRGIALARTGGGAANGAATPARRPLVVGVAAEAMNLAALWQSLAAAAIAYEQVPRVGLVTVVVELTDRLARGGERGLLVTDQVTAALCLANRNRGVRAAVGGDRATVDEAMQAVGANLLVLDPRGKSTFHLRGALERFAKGAGDCPEWLAGRLA